MGSAMRQQASIRGQMYNIAFEFDIPNCDEL